MPIGKFGGRIYIPVYQNRKEVCFTTRSIQVKGHAKYTHCYDDKSIVPIKDCLYGLDDCKNDHVVLVEGVTDVWNIGTDTVCMFGKTLSDIQKRLLVKKFKTIFVLLDPDAFKQAKQIKAKLAPYRKTICLALKDKDPGELTKQEVYELLNEINKLKGKQ
jgi:DNA primase